MTSLLGVYDRRRGGPSSVWDGSGRPTMSQREVLDPSQLLVVWLGVPCR